MGFVMNARPSKRLWLVLFVIVLAVLLLSFCSPKKKEKIVAAAKPALTISTEKAQLVAWRSQLPAAGAVVPWQEAIIGARTMGLPLVDVLVNVGDQVQKGQVLARFDDRSVRADLAQAEASLAAATANAKQAAANRDRVERLRESGAISVQDAQQTSTQAEASAAQQALAKAALDSAKVRLENTQVRAPDAGVISARQATLGQVPNNGQELFRLIRQNRLEWRAEATLAGVTQLKVGLPATVTLPDGQAIPGHIRQISPALESNTRMAIVYVDLQAPKQAKAGMYVNGYFNLASTQALVVPSISVAIRDGKSYVFVLQKDHVKQVLVETGRREGDLMQIISGLKAGDDVAAKGAGFLNDNDFVRVISPTKGE